MIYAKTPSGQAAMHVRSADMSPRQRTAFIMFDGKRDSAEVLKATSVIGVTAADFEHFLTIGFLAPVSHEITPRRMSRTDISASPMKPFAEGKPSALSQSNYSTAYPIATRLTAALGLRGFRLNLAVEAAGDLEKLKELAPRIKDAIGVEKFKELEDALYSF